jgi:hypothetical protein
MKRFVTTPSVVLGVGNLKGGHRICDIPDAKIMNEGERV